MYIRLNKTTKTIFMAGAIVFLLVCCDGSESGNFECITAVPELNDAAEAYNQDPSTENCNEYRAALQRFINNGCAGMDQSAYAELDGLPCN
jgi:hypothetical protein